MVRTSRLLWLFSALLLWLVACPAETPAPEPAPTPSTDQASTPSTAPPTPTTGPRKLATAQPVPGEAIRMPYILWGGDMATFYGNGGTRTTKGSVFDQSGLVVELTPGDNFDQQVADYTSGKTQFLRGTFRMIGTRAEELTQSPGDQPMVFMQMTWSAGDHLVGRDTIKTIADLKGKKVAVQKGGPHVGMLDDVLHTAGLTFGDVEVVYVDNITGEGSAAELFRSNPGIDAGFAITPDMLSLTGGLESAGTGAEGTVKGARVVVSTAELSHSIADVYAVRRSYWESNPEVVNKFVAAYLKSVEQVIALKKQYENAGSDEYLDLMQLSQNIYGKDVLPTLEEDAHGLLSDCAFAGHPGNVSFFLDPKNVHGFADFNKRSQDLAVDQKLASNRVGVLPSPIKWDSAEIKGSLTRTDVKRTERFQAEAVLSEIESMDADGVLDSRTLLSFTIGFEPNQTVFDAQQYADQFERVFELAARYGNAAVVIRGHSDTTLVLRDAVKAGMENGKLKRSGSKGNYQYFLDGRPLNIEDLDEMQKAISSADAFKPVAGIDPRKTMQAALNLSRQRSQAVRESLIQYARTKGVRLDESQVQSQGVGIREPLVARPQNPEQAGVNRRVEFRLVRVSAEAITSADFDF